MEKKGNSINSKAAHDQHPSGEVVGRRRIVVLGAGESGAGAAVLAQKEGFDVFVSDMSKIAPRYKEMLDARHIVWEEGQHTEELILNADEIVKSPGIPDTAPMVARAVSLGISVISEIEFAGRYTKSKMVCITGSNGKTTTTSLIYHIFKAAGYDVGLAGNIGRSLALQVAEEPHEYYVIELSSFQLDNMYDFRANIAVLLNITPDHLDRYGFEMQNYVDAKMRILQNQTESDAFIYWNNDPIIKRELEKYDIKAIQYPFSELREKGSIGYIEEGRYVIEKPEPFNMEQERLSLTGRHNIYNSLAAGIASRVAGIKNDVIRQSLSDFPGVEHRLEKVCSVRGVSYVNDSKATNVDACWYALDSMKTPVVLILGGKDKGNDYEPIKPLVRRKCRGLVYLGADNAKLHQNFDAMGLPVRDTHSMKECVAACYELAQAGDTVLLSPCCASFDLFKNMEDRGEQFKELVRNL
ncbi:MAG: UDP-N-acetylmuramoyl-L-alanine--D-glutamate ligase [Prevotella sp.]|nr:UDP-N-acetylmuramoyl-L-alanine--D-glutamate ligase [Prevotella sp.]